MSAETGHHDTLITVSPDSAADGGLVPARGVAAFQYTPLAGHPYELTQADALFLAAHRYERGTAHWDAFFARPRACLRASPLPKTCGWGLHFDAAGRIALLAVDSEAYSHLLHGGHVTPRPALRSYRSRRPT